MVPAPKQRGAIAKPRVGRAFCGLPWEGIDDAINPSMRAARVKLSLMVP